MRIGGWQKVSLIDFPGKISTIVFTTGCVFRCGFCYNPKLVVPPLAPAIDEREIFAYLEKRRGQIQGVVITGGEPTVHADLPAFIERVRNLGYTVKLDSCGYLPERLETIFNAKLVDYVAMDIKAPLPKYSELVGITIEPARIERSIELIKRSGIPYEFRTTIVREFHSPQDIVDMASLIRGADQYFLQRFQPGHELVNQEFRGKTAYHESELRKIAERCQAFVTRCEVR